ncbi:MAG: argininosuccinate lyase [Kofleriaceae bacterium]|nr:argininosuccinate lyase [Kofleriaceae bacterium]
MTKEKGARSRRFEGGLAPDAVEVNSSVHFDYRLLPYDVAGSIAHSGMLAKQGIIPSEDAGTIKEGLLAVEKELSSGKLDWDPKLEDVHMNVEAHLSQRIGDAGRRLHTGRSRNDQVATDMRLYARDHALQLSELIDQLRLALVDLAAEHVDDFLPGYTHLQRAQPIRLGHHLLAYNEMLRRDKGRLLDARKRAGECPLGSGALAATTFPLDREMVAAELGFDGVTHNSLDAVGDRDFVVELIAAIALCQVHLSRLGEELVLWLSQEFQFATLGQSYCSGSSIMPQKVNPDLAELIRGKAGRVIGDWVTVMTVLKGLPMAYNKDLQESQEPLFDAVETLNGGLRVAIGMIQNLEFNTENTRNAVDKGYLVATEVADYLVSKGLPFRQGHDAAGALVAFAIKRGVELGQLSLEDFQSENALFEKDIFEWLDVARVVDRRDIVGGPAKNRILDEIERARTELSYLASL